MTPPSVPKKLVYVIVLNWNGLEDTRECVKSLLGADYPDFRIMVVDNASAGAESAMLEAEFGNRISIVQNDRNYGYAEGNNRGIVVAI